MTTAENRLKRLPSDEEKALHKQQETKLTKAGHTATSVLGEFEKAMEFYQRQWKLGIDLK